MQLVYIKSEEDITHINISKMHVDMCCNLNHTGDCGDYKVRDCIKCFIESYIKGTHFVRLNKYFHFEKYSDYYYRPIRLIFN